MRGGCGRPQHQQRLHIQPLRKPFITMHNQHFIEVYHFNFNNFILIRERNLYVILARRNEPPEDGILNVETCRGMLFVIIVFDIIVQIVGQIVNNKRSGIILGKPPAYQGTLVRNFPVVT